MQALWFPSVLIDYAQLTARYSAIHAAIFLLMI
ncbi:hypothetical protein PANA5342_3560 [Pantoea ananatis LMG 5342]|nr:hypothetical protein PANA5342_3560 [Pantoea ananatis LMG 5342]